MITGLLVLIKRGISWAQVFRNNAALISFILYCGISVVWSEFPFVAFKRWLKAFGDPIMVLILLTDRDPLRAVDILLRVCTNTLIPLSILFTKYYPELGRSYDYWTGQVSYTGVATNKNLLGFALMVCGLSLVWRLNSRGGNASGNKVDNIGIPLLLLGMVAWLLKIADSQTSLVGFIFGLLVFFILGRQTVRRNLVSYLFLAVALFAVLQASFNITESLIRIAGRNTTLTGRTELWDILLKLQAHPILGFGFESFWLGDRLRSLQELYYFKPNQAHNGYIEMYLNLGCVGLLFFFGVIVSSVLKSREMLVSTPEMTEGVVWGRFGIAFIAVYLFYNYTEAAFKSPHFLFAIFLLFAIKVSESKRRVAPSSLTEWPRDCRKAPFGNDGPITVPVQ